MVVAGGSCGSSSPRRASLFQSAFRAKGTSVKGVEAGVGMGTDSRLVEGFNWLQQGVVLQDLALITY